MNDQWQFARDAWPFVVIALFGGGVRAARFGVRSIRQFAVSMLCSGFVGFLAALALQDSNVGNNIVAVAAGASGYCGGALLDALQFRVLHQVRGECEKKEGE